MLKGMKIRTKILLSAMSVLVLALSSRVIITSVNIARIAERTEEINSEIAAASITSTDEALLEQAYTYLLNIADIQSQCSNAVLENISRNVMLVETATRDIFENPEYFIRREIGQPGDPGSDAHAAIWMVPGQSVLNDTMIHEVDLLSNLAMIMPGIVDNSDVLDFFVGTENGVFYNCTPPIVPNPDYDPRERPWYIQAVNNPGQVVFTLLYEDAFGTGKVLTAAKAITMEDGTLVGVAGLDIGLSTLEAAALDARVMPTGYTFIIDENGHYIVHPDLGDEDFDHFRAEHDHLFADALERMMAGERGYEWVDTDSGPVYLVFAPLDIAGWSIGLVTPESDILSSRDSLAIRMETVVQAATEEINLLYDPLLAGLLIISFITLVLLLSLSFFLSRAISRPIQELAKGVKLFGGGAYGQRISVETTDEIGELAGMFNQMADNIVANMGEIAFAATEKERINGELRIAARIQRDMLPDIAQKLARLGSIDVYASVEPALEMGGDMYDLFFHGEERRKLCGVVADVSGKGMPAAMFMVMAKTLIRNFVLGGLAPDAALREANIRLCEDNPACMFVTMALSLVDLTSGHCQYAQAGHEPVAYCPAGGDFVFIETQNTTPLGCFADSDYPLYEFMLKPGDKCFLYTDGISEALDEQDVEWGLKALLSTLNANRLLPCAQMAGQVREAVMKHRGMAPQSDDITILAVEYLAFSTDTKALSVKNSLDELGGIFAALGSVCGECGLSPDIADELCLCMDEVFSNIVKYAYDDDEEHMIEISFNYDSAEKSFSITIIDDGKAFNPLEAEAPNLDPDLGEREPGGLGLYIVANTMDKLDYQRLDGMNRLKMVRKIQ